MATRPSVPSEVKRQLRQEAGFGCCSCGYPFVEYHHIVPFADEPHFRPGDMMVLCSRCHDLCTVGALTEAEQRSAKARPKNVVDNELRGLLYVNSAECKVRLGGGMAVDTPDLINFRGTTMLGIERADDGRVLVSALIQNPEGEIVAQLARNEWILAPDALWDFDAKPRIATARSGPGAIAFEVDARGDTMSVRGTWWAGGAPVRFTEDRITFRQNQIMACNVVACRGFIRLE